jgi:hypothetical protein
VVARLQDTLREPPAAAKSMKKTVPLALTTTFILVRRALPLALLRCMSYHMREGERDLLQCTLLFMGLTAQSQAADTGNSITGLNLRGC